MQAKIGISARHVHVTKEDFEILFGMSEMTIKKPLLQKGEYASAHTVTLKTAKNQMERVRILGPFRTYTQVELARTDAYHLGIDPPIRTSGNLMGASSIEIIGPKGTIERQCVIIAERHIHLSKEDREKLGLTDREEVDVLVDNEKGGILSHVKLKTGPDYVLECHLDTDDGNAFLLKTGDIIEFH